jgi:anaerobic selenocysteine-containing dehydrogenase
MLVEASNPAHSLADSRRMREALAALDTLVVIDVAMSETARLAHYVLPAATQFEKAEATFFNFDFPRNYFHLRARLYPPPPGPLPEAEIHARLLEALGQFGEADLAPLRAAAAAGTAAYAEAFLERVLPDPRLAPLAAVLLYRTLPLPDDVREGAAVLGLALKAAMEHGPSLERAGFGGPPLAAAEALFSAILAGRSGVVFAVDEWAEVLGRIATPDGKLHLALPDMLAALNELCRSSAEPHDDAFPFVLSAGERRSFTANTIIRDPAWRRTDARGALCMNPSDAAALGIGSGDSVRLTTRRASAVVTVEVSERMQRGHVSLPNGLGTSYPDGAGLAMAGVAPNELTTAEDRDPFVGTPWHKHVPARIETLSGEPRPSRAAAGQPSPGS